MTKYTYTDSGNKIVQSLQDLDARTSIRKIVEAFEKEEISAKEAVMMVSRETLDGILYSNIDSKQFTDEDIYSKIGMPGAAKGLVATSLQDAAKFIEKGLNFIFVVNETSAIHNQYIEGDCCKGIVTFFSGITSHAAIKSLQEDKPAVIGVGAKNAQALDLKSGEEITIDGLSKVILRGQAKIIEADPQNKDFRRILEVSNSIKGDKIKKIDVKVMSENPDDIRKSIDMGADGVGVARTEHMFFKEDRLTKIQALLVTDSKELRQSLLSELLPLQKEDCKEILKASGEKVARIRLLDAPLHEFMPSDDVSSDEIEKITALLDRLGVTMSVSELEGRIENFKENNPMLGGKRAVREGILNPDIYEMQIKAILEGAAELVKEGIEVKPAIFSPLIAIPSEVKTVNSQIDRIKSEVEKEYEVNVPLQVGSMAEIPSSCLQADEIAAECDFISCGMNDLTQTTYGFSRGDTADVIAHYIENGLIPFDFFQEMGEPVKELVGIAVERGKKANNNLEISVCGEQGATSMKQCYDIGVDSVSVSLPNIPYALIASSQELISRQQSRWSGEHIGKSLEK